MLKKDTFTDYWISHYLYIGSEHGKENGMPDEKEYGLSKMIIKDYVEKKYNIQRKRCIKVGSDVFKIDEFVAQTCLILGVCGGLGMFFVSFMHPILAGICGYGLLFGIYFLTRFIVLKLDYRDYQTMKIDTIERYLQDYEEWLLNFRKNIGKTHNQ